MTVISGPVTVFLLWLAVCSTVWVGVWLGLDPTVLSCTCGLTLIVGSSFAVCVKGLVGRRRWWGLTCVGMGPWLLTGSPWGFEM